MTCFGILMFLDLIPQNLKAGFGLENIYIVSTTSTYKYHFVVEMPKNKESSVRFP